MNKSCVTCPIDVHINPRPPFSFTDAIYYFYHLSLGYQGYGKDLCGGKAISEVINSPAEFWVSNVHPSVIEITFQTFPDFLDTLTMIPSLCSNSCEISEIVLRSLMSNMYVDPAVIISFNDVRGYIFVLFSLLAVVSVAKK
jgi:hypothetical protein